MIIVGGIQLALSEIILGTGLMLSLSFTFFAVRRVAQMQQHLHSIQRAMSREIKMVNQGAIGVGRRMAEIEKNLKSKSNVANFAPAQELKQHKQRFAEVQKSLEQKISAVESPAVGGKGLSTKAEQALSAWLNDQKTA